MIMYRFGSPSVIVSDNGTHFVSTIMVNFCKDLLVQTKFISIIHPYKNRHEESVNKVLLKLIKKKLSDAKGLWAEQPHKLL